jgi:hypothetical protein
VDFHGQDAFCPEKTNCISHFFAHPFSTVAIVQLKLCKRALSAIMNNPATW